MTTPTEVTARTFLELCQDVAREAGVTGTQNTVVPTTVSGQVGELERIVRWVKAAWRDIQGRRHWNWMWENAALTLPLGASSIAGTVPSERYLTGTARRPSTTSDGLELEYIPWDEWQDWYSDAYVLAGNSPTVFTVTPANAIQFNGTASVALTPPGAMDFTVQRYRNPTELRLDADVPGMPADLMDLIVYKALLRYANFDEAGATRQTVVLEIARLERDLIARCLPQIRLGGPMTDY